MTDTTETPATTTSATADQASTVRVWPAMAFADVDTMLGWLRAVGFVEHVTHRDDEGTVVHAEWLWPGGGGIMFGAVRETSPLHEPGKAGTYLVTDDPDRVVAAALAAGGTLQRPVLEQDYGGREGSVLDPEGNHWSFGSYQPA
ncbi:glyoxalase [Nocardioides sp. zg-ZUI104]|uniref:VOC family protein n=1 Tax=Nocardioides faecalis TaxID=2803858 RepID=UPI001BCF6D4D|nr:VOC family protein [Nocardioides faecalis]MBS4753738.1 glyoxalase [Nocardioides faecalis]